VAFQAAPEFVPSLTATQYSTIYNLFSLVIASMLFTAIFLLASQRRVAPRFRQAVVVSAIVCGIAAYHYFRIFANFKESYLPGATAGDPHLLSNIEFNEAYRYVDWLLTVPLLLLETVAVMALARQTQRRLLARLIPASALMILLGYPGELSSDLGTRALWGFLSTIPFVFLLYVLFVELSRSLDRQPAEVVHTIKMLRVSLVGLWGIYPIAYLFPMIGGDFFGGAGGFVLRQGGYSIADILAKAAYGLAIYKIARVKSRLEDPQYDDAHDGAHDGAAGTDGDTANTPSRAARVPA
jgi:bacteriorhodopsin